MSRLPIRLRVTAAFAVAMAAVLAGTGLFLYLRLASHLALALDRDLQLRAQDLAALVSQPRASLARESRGGSSSGARATRSCSHRTGASSTPRRPLGADAAPVPPPSCGRRGAARSTSTARPSRAWTSPRACSRRPSRAAGGRSCSSSARRARTTPRRSRASATSCCSPARSPCFSPPASATCSPGSRSRQVESMRRRAARSPRDTPGERLPVPPTGDELRAARRDAERDARPARGGARARARLRRRRRPRAAHAARAAADRARARAPSGDRRPTELREAVRRSSYEAERLSQLAEDLLLIARADRGPPAAPGRARPGGRPVRRGREPLRLARRRAAARTIRATLSAGPPRRRATGSDSSRRSATWSTTRSATAATDLAERRRAPTTQSSSTSRDDGERVPAEAFSPAPSSASPAPTLRAAAAGAGLGLSIVETIARSHGGTAQVAEAPTAGPTCGSPCPS